jgi:ATP-dependent Clp protease ATP-binding subunit ClpA
VRLHHGCIEAEHIFLGLLIEGSGVAANVLENLDVDLKKLGERLEKRMTPGTAKELPQLPFSVSGKKVLEYAIDEARMLDHNYVGTEHLLLGLLRQTEGVAAHLALAESGLALENVRREVREFLGLEPPAIRDTKSIDRLIPQPPSAGLSLKSTWWWAGFDESCYRVFDAARNEAHRNKSADISGEHLLLGLCRASYEIKRVGLDPAAVIEKVSQLHPVGSTKPVKSTDGELLPFSPSGKYILELALEEAFATKRSATCRHLLIALLLYDGEAGKILKSFGLTLEASRKKS